MFKIIECEQRTPEWIGARIGMPTGSCFSKFITPTGKKSASAEDAINRLVAEKVIGKPDETFVSDAMLRGAELEDEALLFVNTVLDYNFKKYGFLDSEKGWGYSPDALDLEKRVGLELKCPSLHTHIEYITSGELPKEYKPQVQGGMLVTGFSEWVFCSYYPDMKPFIITVKRDDDYINSLREILEVSCQEIKRKYELVTAFLGND